MSQQGSPQPFERLNEADQRIAVEIAVVASLLVTRLPQVSNLIFDAISREFGNFYGIPHNTAKYSLRSLGQTMFNTQWTCAITKDAEGNILTAFKQGEPIQRENGTIP